MNWLLAIRPQTLTVSIGPVLVGISLAFQDGFFSWGYAAVTLGSALLIQIGTNLCNDYFDFLKGADTHERTGPVRVTQAGLIAPEQVRTAFIGAFTLAACLGLVLIWRGGWVIAGIGLLSIVSGIAYTAGPYALAYMGLGEVFVLIFFGPVAVVGTYYVQALRFSWTGFWAGIALGLLACAILVVNNLRDLEQDKKAGKNTLAVRFGPNFTNFEYVFCLLAPALIAFYLKVWAASGLLVIGLFILRKSTLSQLLPRTACLGLVFAGVLALTLK